MQNDTRPDKVLLPCPFCGSPASKWTDGAYESEARPSCDNCGCTAPSYAAWNTRPRQAQPAGDVVEQCDREAAALALGYKDYDDATDYRIPGVEDTRVRRMVQAFAHHRQAAETRARENALEEAAKFVELIERREHEWIDVYDVSAAIRAMIDRAGETGK